MRINKNPSFDITIKSRNQLSVELIKNLIAADEQWSKHSHVHPHTEIIWITEGAGKLYVDMQVVELAPFFMYFIQPGQMHKLQTIDQTIGYSISIPNDLIEHFTINDGPSTNHEFRISMQEIKSLIIEQHTATDMKDILELMLKESLGNREYADEILIRYFKIFLFYLGTQMKNVSRTIQNRNLQVVRQFQNLVETHYKTKKLVSEYACELNLTPNYLNEIIKKVTGHSAGHIIRQRIALEAKRFAIHSGACMKEIGYHLGFSDMGHFSKFFKAVVGSNFTKFKNGVNV